MKRLQALYQGGKIWFEKYGGKLYFSLVLLLVGSLSFMAGKISEEIRPEKPIVISVPNEIPEAKPVEKRIISGVQATNETLSSQTTDPVVANQCAYVGSRKSNKYHLPTSRCAKQIKTENKICFVDLAAAEKKGYLPGCLSQ